MQIANNIERLVINGEPMNPRGRGTIGTMLSDDSRYNIVGDENGWSDTEKFLGDALADSWAEVAEELRAMGCIVLPLYFVEHNETLATTPYRYQRDAREAGVIYATPATVIAECGSLDHDVQAAVLARLEAEVAEYSQYLIDDGQYYHFMMDEY